MNTSKLKSFAQDARNILKDGVQNSLAYWGFDKNGHVNEKPEEISGGCIFRGEVFNDPGILRKWHHLNQYIKRHTVDDAIEQAAYTWFNRLMAISILEHNKLERPVIHTDAEQDPPLLAEARTGNLSFLSSFDRERVKALIFNHHDEEAFGMLLTCYSRSHPLLNRIFGGIDDFTELLLPANLLSPGGIIHLINNSETITEADYREVELIGWLYQFYVSEKKDEVFTGFKKNKKARAEDIPAATQIFTPRWIVKYMVENTVGKIWLDHAPDSTLSNEMKYIVDNEGSQATDIISSASDLKLLDPAVGSGHVLVVGFELFLRMYQEEGYTTTQAIREVFKNNLFGLDIDDRAAQLACFAVLLKASFYDPGILQEKIFPNIYAMPEADEFSQQEIYEFLGSKGESYYKELSDILILLQQGKNVGSALKLTLHPVSRLFYIERLQEIIINEKNLDIHFQSIFNRIKPFIEALIVLTGSYESVVTNPPYMGQKNMNSKLKNYININYPLSKSDLFAVFMEVCYLFLIEKGRYGMINQQSWMFLSSYETLRKSVLRNQYIESMIHLGPRTFDELSGEVVQNAAFIVKNSTNIKSTGTFFRVIDGKNSEEKNTLFLDKKEIHRNISQSDFFKIPGVPIAYWASKKILSIFETYKPFKEISPARIGMMTTDNERFLRQWWEVYYDKIGFGFANRDSAEKSSFKWFPYNKGGGFRKWYGNNELVVNWYKGGEEIKKNGMTSFRGKDFYFKEGVTWSFINSSNFGVRYKTQGYIFDIQGSSSFPPASKLATIIGFLNSVVTYKFLSIINPTLSFQGGNINNLPYVNPKEFYDEINENTNICIQIARNDWDSNEISWDFKKHPFLFIGASNLENCFKKWQSMISSTFFQLQECEEKLNKIFIKVYGLEEELSAKVIFKDITISQDFIEINKLDNCSNKFSDKLIPVRQDIIVHKLLSYLLGCLMGRYRLDKEGLNIAQPNPLQGELQPYIYKGFSIEVDQDAIIPLLGDDSPFTDDIIHKIRYLIEAIWGEKTLTENINFIEDALGVSLEKFLTTKFWDYHKRMYKKIPIYWLFESPGGFFRVLTYMHRMDKFTVQKIRLNYLHRYIDHLTAEITRLKQNENNQRKVEKLEDALFDCRKYSDILKPLADRQITFDLDDGFKKNYKLFEGAVKPI